MQYLLHVFVLSVILLSNPSARAQTQPSPCETDKAYRLFDFWIGDWSVTDQSTGQHAGTNSISSIEGGCALEERWTNTAGATGRSINYYNPITDKWRQVWVSQGAYSLDIAGNMSEGSMLLEGTIYYYATGQSFPFKGKWTPLPDGTVRQYFEQYAPEEKVWNTWFDGVYVKQ